jgi:hypothetical protein
MHFVDFPLDFAPDCLLKFRALLPEGGSSLLVANVVQTVSVYGGLV